MKKIKLLGLLMPLLAMGLVGCGEPEVKYSSDKTNHWQIDADGNEVADTKAKHEFVEAPEKGKAATCKEKGTKVEVCSVCGYEKTSEIKILDHVLSVDEGAGVAATCGAEGKKVEKCANCDYVKETPIAKTAHNLGAGTEKSDEKGTYMEYECSICHQKASNRVAFASMLDSSSTEASGDGTKLNTDGTAVSWNVCLPAGEYSVYFVAKFSSSGANYPLTGSSSRGVEVTYNGTAVEFDGTRTAEDLGLSTSEYKSFTFCNITATGGTDTITLKNPYYRFVFETASYITFAPVAK